MPSSLRDLLIVLGRWPRRLAAVACLLLAASSALAARAQQSAPARSGAPSPAPARVPDRLGVPVHVRGAPGYLHPGDRVDLLAAPPEPVGADPPASARSPAAGEGAATASAVATGVTVLRVAESAGGDGTDLVVAVDRATGLRIAALGTREVVAALVTQP